METGGWEIKRPIPQAKIPTRQGGAVFLASDRSVNKKQYVGFCRVVNSPWGEVEIKEVCVAPNYRRKGIGRMLVDKVIKAANGKVVVAWGVDQGPKFYKALGFRQSKAPVFFCHTSS